MNLAHIHLLLNHFPTIGMIIGIGLFLIGLLGKSHELKEASLVVFLGIAMLALPTYMSGNAAQEKICFTPTKDAPCKDLSVSKALIRWQARSNAAWPRMHRISSRSRRASRSPCPSGAPTSC